MRHIALHSIILAGLSFSNFAFADEEPVAVPKSLQRPAESTVAPAPAISERPSRVRRLEVLGGLGTRPYGNSLGSEWSHQPSESPLIRVEVAQELWNYSRQFAFSVGADLDYMKSVQRLSSSSASSSIVTEHGFIGGSGGLTWAPSRGFGFRASVGLIFSLFGKSELRSAGFTTELKAMDQSLLSLGSRTQAGLTGYYEMNERSKVVVESRLLGGNASYLIAGVGYEL